MAEAARLAKERAALKKEAEALEAAKRAKALKEKAEMEAKRAREAKERADLIAKENERMAAEDRRKAREALERAERLRKEAAEKRRLIEGKKKPIKVKEPIDKRGFFGIPDHKPNGKGKSITPPNKPKPAPKDPRKMKCDGKCCDKSLECGTWKKEGDCKQRRIRVDGVVRRAITRNGKTFVVIDPQGTSKFILNNCKATCGTCTEIEKNPDFGNGFDFGGFSW